MSRYSKEALAPRQITSCPAISAARRYPCTALRWGAFALILDVAAMLHGASVIWIVLTYNRHWAYWDAQMAGTNSGYTIDDVANDFMPVMLFLVLAWTISLAAATFAWIRILRAPVFVGRLHAH